MSYVDYWSTPPEAVDAQADNSLYYPPNLTTADIDYVAKLTCERSAELEPEQLAFALFFLNAYTYGGLLAQSFYYRIVDAVQRRDSDRLMRLLKLDKSDIVPEIYRNDLLSVDERNEIISRGLAGITGLWQTVRKVVKHPELLAEYNELLPCRSLQAQICSQGHCRNLTQTCYNQLLYSEFDFEGLQPIFSSTEQFVKAGAQTQLLRTRDLLLELALAREDQRQPHLPHSSQEFDSKMLQLFVAKYKDEIKVYQAFVRWYRNEWRLRSTK